MPNPLVQLVFVVVVVVFVVGFVHFFTNSEVLSFYFPLYRYIYSTIINDPLAASIVFRTEKEELGTITSRSTF